MSKKGYKISEAGRRNIAAAKVGEKNPNWRGDAVGYAGVHTWIKQHLPKPKECQDCRKVKPLDLANKSGNYRRDVEDWEWLCRRCHMTKDGRLEKTRAETIARNGRRLGTRKKCRLCGRPNKAHLLCNRHYIQSRKT